MREYKHITESKTGSQCFIKSDRLIISGFDAHVRPRTSKPRILTGLIVWYQKGYIICVILAPFCSLFRFI